ncbi:hypothetical protein ABEG10_23170 [Burkholderia cenocepacia]|uniref:hypothetical protein n=1 Tax=Burkholderia cenocepacia TaxID=95486 RepID=UPI00209E5941|nr:hypothetical protein [Burkholderia cenocepacia]MCO8325956.1 hypothetical protein [Burkholderia cenocepacia]MCO8333026.1 hypothetical protein [Burkholderia cenocepacia]MCO8340526.1 hypothetical protein [Burkholderia cenocepacia]MCO8347812.1 hypothetical protein [Burkholderia cenocepacia]MCO8360878.1 hypothetical protein [Burkholderia cenocepacia]
MEEVKFEIGMQGAPRVSHTYIAKQADGIVAFFLEMHSKRCEIVCMGSDADGTPIVDIEAGEHGLHLDESKPKDSFTEVRFPDLKGWSVHSTGSGRYTIAICMIRNIDNGD